MQEKISTGHPTTFNGFWKTILITGFIAGTLDAIAAIVVYRAHPGSMFRFIASGAFGAGHAFSGSSMMVWWGVIFHYFIACAWTSLFFLLYPSFSMLQKNKYITGALYGIVVWVVMNLVIVPLSAISTGPFNIRAAAIGAGILIFAIGLPISIMAHRYYSRRKFR